MGLVTGAAAMGATLRHGLPENGWDGHANLPREPNVRTEVALRPPGEAHVAVAKPYGED
jgi:hypothetical protein